MYYSFEGIQNGASIEIALMFAEIFSIDIYNTDQGSINKGWHDVNESNTIIYVNQNHQFNDRNNYTTTCVSNYVWLFIVQDRPEPPKQLYIGLINMLYFWQ